MKKKDDIDSSVKKMIRDYIRRQQRPTNERSEKRGLGVPQKGNTVTVASLQVYANRKNMDRPGSLCRVVGFLPSFSA